MAKTLDLENERQINVPVNYRSGASEKQAKITGFLCLACAGAAVLFALLGSAPTFISSWSLMLYFVFLLFAAAFGLIGYAEIEAIGKGWLSSAFLLISIALLIITFSSISLKPREFGFGVLYGIFSTLIPLMLTVSVLITNKTALWKALLPLGVPVCSILAYPLTTSAGFPVGASMPALGWGLLGIVAYQGRK